MASDKDFDSRAIRILFDTYWSAAGWKKEGEQTLSPDDFQYAKQAGLMFDAFEATHDQIVDQAVNSKRSIDRREVADAFVCSLNSRRLFARSALGSFAVLQHFRHHTAEGWLPYSSKICGICGCPVHAIDKVDRNVFNFERFKWGGVRHDHPDYASFDLQQFQKLDRSIPTPVDVASLKSIFDAIDAAPPKTTAGQLEKVFAKQLKSNKAERDAIVAILGYCGILEVADHPGYRHDFVPVSQRELPNRHWIDMAYPACWWKRSDGINLAAIEYWFGHLL